ncbi:hypothetical protein [Duganella sp. LjRoot269]|uniref:hypothetical protein n=1 Tax=Duganella sp. LjRoot269 TaxID=3342305 RepID=UPI003ECC7469
MPNIFACAIDRDDRLQSYCVTAKCSYADFLDLTTGAEANLVIQRAIIKGAKAYVTLREDLKRGCVLPPIVLAATVEIAEDLEAIYQSQEPEPLNPTLAALTSPEVYIIDGLQRTNAIRQTANELQGVERDDFLERPIRVEIWLNIPFGAVAYRMLLLNAGQRPMSVKHQVEVLSSKLIDDLAPIPNLDIFRVSDGRRRAQPGQFPLAKLAQAFQAWLQGQPNLDLRNTVMEELLAESAIEVLGNSVGEGNGNGNVEEDGFYRLVGWLVQLDTALGVDHIQFLGNETVMLGIAAAIGSLERSNILAKRVWPALNTLLADATLRGATALALPTFEAVRQGIDSSTKNVGVATREMVFTAFKEYIRGAAETDMNECWLIGAAKD